MIRSMLSLYMILSVIALRAELHEGDSLGLTALEAPVSELLYHVRLVPDRLHATGVSIYWDYISPAQHRRADYIIVPATEIDNTDSAPIECKVYRVTDGIDSLVATFSSFVRYGRGRDAAISAILRANGDGARLDFGGRTVCDGFDVPFSGCAASIGFKADREVRVLADNLITRYSSERSRYTRDIVFDSNDPLSGQWRYLDRDADQGRVPSGIDYDLAVVAEIDSTYTIIYAGESLDGWKHGDVKGRLTPTHFENHFDLEWFDQSGRRYFRDTSADLLVDGQVLRLNFPILGTSVRFRRF